MAFKCFTFILILLYISTIQEISEFVLTYDKYKFKEMGRKSSKHGKHENKVKEKEHLLKAYEEEGETTASHTAISSLTLPTNGKPERKRSAWAPVATATCFEDVPVFTICPYCNQKCVTKTHFKKGRKHWFCCYCLPYFLDVFKDVIHSCPKCSKQIAIYNRFHLFKKESHQLNNNLDNASIDINQEVK